MRFALPLVLAALLAGCGLWGGGDAALKVAVADDPALARTLAAEASSASLIRRDANGAVVPGLASSWRFLDEGRTLIMRLKPERWPGSDDSAGRELTARDVLASLRQDRAQLPAGLVVRAPIARVVEMRLPRAEPLLLEQLAVSDLAISRGRQPFPGAYRSQREGRDWLLSWRDEGETPTGAARLQIGSQPAGNAIVAFRAGTLDVVLGNGLANVLEARGAGAAALRLEANWGMTGLLLGRRGALADVRVRRALALTAPRAAIADALALAVLQPQSRLVPGLPALPPLPPATAMAEARKLLEQAGQGIGQGGAQRLRLQLLLPEGAAAGRIADALATAWAPLGVDVVPVNKPEMQRRRLLGRPVPLADVDMALVEWATPLPDAALFLARLRCGRRLACTPAADALLAQANATSDLAKRQTLLAEAESRWREDAQLVPLANPIGWALVKTDVDGFQANSAGVHPLWPLRRRG